MATLQQRRCVLDHPSLQKPATSRKRPDRLHTCFCYLMQAVADIVRTTLGPRAMLKMLLDASGGALAATALQQEAAACMLLHGDEPILKMSTSMWCYPGIILTNDGNAILREIDVAHPAAKVMLQSSCLSFAWQQVHAPAHGSCLLLCSPSSSSAGHRTRRLGTAPHQ